MILSELRTDFTKKSGRADLADDAIDSYINAGIKKLDLMLGLSPATPTPPLTDPDDSNWWSEEHPIVVIWAALYHLEVDYRNTEGANDWLKSIGAHLIGLDHDLAEEQADGINVMEG